MDINNLWSGYDLNSKKQNSRCLAVNTILEGKYLVGPVLGQGGFGITYVGYDLNMETKVAIKEYFPVELVSRDTTTMHGDRVLSLSGEKSVTYKAGLKKYVAEAQNVSQFSEVPGVVSVKDFFYANETAYIVMEFIDGISLKDYLKEQGGRLSEEETLKIMRPILDALVQVHKSGIIHRDISPDNIMLTFANAGDKEAGITVAGNRRIKSVKLIDFGAARMTAKNDQKSLTIILKHGYAPEEQYRTHGEQGPWTDVYALCAVLYRMLTGETPVPAMDRMFKDELKSLEQCGVKVSANTAAAILKGLAVKKDDRIQNVQELIAALYEGAKVKGTSGKKNGKKNGLYIGIGAVSAAVVLGGVLLMSGGQKSTIEQGTTVVVETTQESGADQDPTDTSAPTISAGADTIVEINQSEQDEDLGEQIVFYNPQRSVAGYNFEGHILICKPDGTVEARGNNDDGQCDVEYWDHVAAVAVGEGSSFGLRTDGTVLYAGSSTDFEQVNLWTDIVDIQVTRHCVVGLKSDGTVVSIAESVHVGDREEARATAEEAASWTNIRSLASKNYGIYGLTDDGTVLVAGDEMDEEITGWTDVENLVVYNRIYGIREDGSLRVNGEEPAPDGNFKFFDGSLGVYTDGTIYPKNTLQYQPLEPWNDLVAVCAPSNFTAGSYYGLQEDGTILEYLNMQEGDTAPEEMDNLKWIQAVSRQGDSDRLFAATKENEIQKCGEIWERGNVLDHAGVPCWYSGFAALYEDGTFLYAVSGEEHETIQGVKQVVEMLQHSIYYENETLNNIYAYVILMEDGTVRRLGSDFDVRGIEYYADVFEEYADVENWNDIVQLDCSNIYSIYGLKADGSIVGAGRMYSSWMDRMQDITQYKQILATDNESIFGVTQDGRLNALRVEQSDEERGMGMADGWENVQAAVAGDYHIAALLENGTVKATGGNHCGQCDVEEWTDVVYLTTGKNCTLGITSTGELLMAGSLY